VVEEQVLARAQTLERPLLQSEVVSSFSRFHALQREWDALIKRASVDHPFLSHAWLSTWWESFGNGKQLHVITLWAGRELVAAAPMMITTARMYGLRVTRLESLYNFHTPRYDFIVAADPEAAYPLIWKALSAAEGEWDMVTLAQIPRESPTLARIDELARSASWDTGRWDAPPSPFIRLGCSYESFFGKLKGGYRYNLRKRYEKLCRIGAVDVEVITDKERVREAMLDDGFRIEAAAWKGREGTAMSSDPAVAEFYIRMAERSAELQWLQLTFLRVNGKRIAFDYVMRYGRSLYGVKIGYDPEYHTYSPGNMLLNLILQGACQTGAAEYDFLGVDDEWKFDWTRETRSHQWLFLFRNTARGRFLHRVKFRIIPGARDVISSLTARRPRLRLRMKTG
jgi:CelD/BcsL family acetyltransferase involved in cellulose biosynthesis